MDNNNIILKVLVGSRSHGLHTEESDYDYRGVFISPTSELLKLGAKYKANSWFEGKEDQTMYEIGHFLHLATKCNPSILEVFKAPKEPIVYTSINEGMFSEWGDKLIELFPYVWNPNDAYNAFVGYSCNQRKKMLEKKDGRHAKFAVAYIRTLLNLIDLLEYGDFSLEIRDPKYKQYLLKIKQGDFKPGEIIDLAEQLIEQAKILRDKCKHKPDIEKVNQFLLDVRKEFWE